jgi:hypothetical protein
MATQTFHRGLRDVKIAAWNSDNSYGTEYDVKGAREMTLELITESDRLEGDDVILARITNIIGTTFRFSQAAVDLEALDMLTGGTLVSNGDYENLKIAETDTLPYVSIAGRVMSDGAHDLHVWVPKAKLTGNLQFQAAYGQWVLPAAEFEGVNETTNGLVVMRKYDAATALEIPLRTATGGL